MNALMQDTLAAWCDAAQIAAAFPLESRERSAALLAIDGLREPYRVIAFEAEALEVEVVDERLRDLTASILRKADADLALAIVG